MPYKDCFGSKGQSQIKLNLEENKKIQRRIYEIVTRENPICVKIFRRIL